MTAGSATWCSAAAEISRSPVCGPRERKTPPSAAQVVQKERFSNATVFANRQLEDSATLDFYRALGEPDGISAFAAAVRDWFRKPVVKQIELDQYHGQIGNPIVVVATDDAGIAAVDVVIRDTATQTVLEQGAATGTGVTWTYTATTALPAGAAVQIEATAKDRAKNAGTLNQLYP